MWNEGQSIRRPVDCAPQSVAEGTVLASLSVLGQHASALQSLLAELRDRIGPVMIDAPALCQKESGGQGSPRPLLPAVAARVEELSSVVWDSCMVCRDMIDRLRLS